MRELAIQASGLSKQYRIREANRSAAPRSALAGFRKRSQGFWALRDISFDVRVGEAVGIIGRNGAGKSTLLKILSRITAPTEGRARVRGRVGTLLEVGTGFHPELTGRENIFLSGTILGMTYHEVARKFDAIVAFSEIEKFLDTPVKHYSSGMFVRLAFSVASHLEPEILILDEVLAVGDVGFQRKCLGRLNDVSGNDGRTVLLVSHDLSAIRSFCKRVLVLESGRLAFDGPVHNAIADYMRSISTAINVRDLSLKDRLNRTTGAVRFTEVLAHDSNGNARWQFSQGEDVCIRLAYEVFEPVSGLGVIFFVSGASENQPVWVIREVVTDADLKPGAAGIVEFVIPAISLRPNEFSIRADLCRLDHRAAHDVVDSNVNLPHLIITSDEEDAYSRMGVVSLPYRMKHIAAEAQKSALSA
jgi:homopolymeric O-antigen transport system ATP-binding protein